jgi:hypothetical protein
MGNIRIRLYVENSIIPQRFHFWSCDGDVIVRMVKQGVIVVADDNSVVFATFVIA